MGVANVQHELLALHLRPVANADDLEVLREAGGRSDDHVVDERTGEAVQRTVALIIARTLDGENTVVLLEDHVLRNLLRQLALGAFHGHNIRFIDRDCHSGRNADRKFSDTRHLFFSF